MGEKQEITDLNRLLDRIADSAHEGQVTLSDIMATVGYRSFGPLLLLAGLITLAPILGDIPGVPTLMGILVLLTAGQLLLRRDHLWLPHWLLRRSVSSEKLCKVVGWSRPVARVLDRISRPRLTVLTRGAGTTAISLACVVIAAALPPMELVPFSANGAGAALTAFGLALVAHDGLLALLALTITLLTFGLVAYGLM